MYDYLVDYARKNVWCVPGMDRQSITKPARITPYYGATSSIRLLNKSVDLPLKNTVFHVFQIGQLHPLFLGLFPARRYWLNMAANCNEQNMIVNIYTDNGLQMSLFRTWFMVTDDKNLIIAVAEQQPPDNVPPWIDPGADNIYMRVYTNAFFETARGQGLSDKVVVKGIRAVTQAEIVTIQNHYESYKAKNTGMTFAYVNGQLVDAIDLINARVGDEIEFVYDESIKSMVEFRYGTEKEFRSTLDKIQKMYLHINKNRKIDDTIDFEDDIDVFATYNKPNGAKFDGVYVHRNDERTLRNLTHQDFAVSVPVLNAIQIARKNRWPNIKEMRIRLYIRHSGWIRPTVQENSRIFELYKLSDTLIKQAILGIDANVEVWKAPVLEAAAYPKVMGNPNHLINKPLVEDMLGYNAASKLLADTPAKYQIVDTQRVTRVPYGLVKGSTGFEYGPDGLLRQWHSHVNAELYPFRDDQAETVEVLKGYADQRTTDVYGLTVLAVPSHFSFRCYTCPIVAGVATNKWEDVTDSALYVYQNGVITWAIDPSKTLTLVRTNETLLAYDFNLVPTAGNYWFSLQHRVNRGGSIVTQAMQVPMGDLDLFMNGHSLIEGIDYIVQFPRVMIITKEYIKAPASGEQRITVRFTGLADKDMKWRKYKDVGFVSHGIISLNDRYNVRDDKVNRIVMDGRLWRKDQVKMHESGTTPVTVPNQYNGRPYLVRDVVVPIGEFVDQETYTYKAKSEVIDQSIGDYLTIKYPFKKPTTPNVIGERYGLYSPFMNALLTDLQSGILDDQRIYEHYDDVVVREICDPYLYLLDFDPTQVPNYVDEHYVVIHPHTRPNVVSVPIHFYKFLDRARGLYCNDMVGLSHFVNIETI